MGGADDWQARVVDALPDCIVLNPRRQDWDSSWSQSLDNPEFVQQVEWELSGLEKADTIAFYFDPTTKSPITLMELGIVSQRSPHAAIVCCPSGFWRKGNVDVLCRRYGMKQVGSLDELISAIGDKILA